MLFEVCCYDFLLLQQIRVKRIVLCIDIVRRPPHVTNDCSPVNLIFKKKSFGHEAVHAVECCCIALYEIYSRHKLAHLPPSKEGCIVNKRDLISICALKLDQCLTTRFRQLFLNFICFEAFLKLTHTRGNLALTPPQQSELESKPSQIGKERNLRRRIIASLSRNSSFKISNFFKTKIYMICE